MKKILLFAVALFTLSVNSQSVTRLLVVSNFDNTLRILDTATYAQIGSKTMTFSAGSFQGIHGLARRPSTGVFYGVVNDGAGTRYLASINPVTGSVTNIGSLGDNFSQLTFNANSTLLGLTGSGASAASRVYRINTNTAAKTSVATLNNVYGQVFAYNPSDNRVYHWTGGNSVNYRSYDTSFASSTTINIGASSSEVTSAVYKTGGLFTTSDWDLNYRKVRATGGSSVYTSYSSASYYPKGMAYITCSRSIAPGPSTLACAPVAGITLTMSGVAGATYQWYQNNVAISGATLITLNTATTGIGYYKCRISDGCGIDSLAPGITVAQLPTVTISGTTSACSGVSVNLTGSSGGSSQWYRNGILIGGATTNVYTPTITGIYNMMKTNLNGCKDSASVGKSFTVSATPTITVANGNVCPGAPFVFSPTGASTYTIAGGSFTVSPVVTTTYAISGTSTAGCVGNAVGTVSVQNSLVVAITGNTAVCIGLPQVLTASGAGTYTWNTGAVSNTIAPSPSVQTTYSVIGASGSCSNTASFTLSVNPRPTVTASVSNAAICSGGNTTLTATGANTYTWTGGAVNGASFAPTASNSYSVTGTNTLTGCTNSNVVSVSVTVNALPVISASSTASVICNGVSTTLNGGGANTYTWSGGVTNGTAFTPTATAQYSVTGTSAANCAGSNTAVITITVNPRPTITVNSGSICSGYVFTMVPGGASTYSYSTASGSNTLSAISSTNINVSGTSALGCTSTVSAVANITVVPSPTVTASSGTVCLGLTFSIQPSGANTYSLNGTVTNSIGGVSPAVNTNYSVTGTGTNGCVTPGPVVASVSVVANPTITAVAASTAICIGQATAVLTAGGANTYTWSTNAQTSTIAVSPTATSVYSVSGTSTLLCTSTNTVSVLVNPLPAMSITPTKTFICVGENVNLTASGASTYTWSTVSNSVTVNVNPTVNATYTVTGTDALGCVNLTTQSILVNTITISVSPNSTVCLGSAITLTAGGAVTYTWNGTQLFPSFPVTPTALTVYTVNALDANNCPQSKTVSVGVFQLPVVTASPSRSLICVGESATVTASGANTYVWNNGSTNTSIVVSPTLNLLQTYSVTGTDSNSCTASATTTMGVSLCTGIESVNVDAKMIHLYPNPNNGEFVITSESILDLKIVNELGQLVGTITLDENNGFKATVNNLAEGVYFIIGVNNTNLINQKVIVTK